MENDLKSYTKTDPAIVMLAHSEIVDGLDIDTAGFESLIFVVHAGTIGGGNAAFVMQHADDDGSGSPDTYADVAATDLIGAYADIALPSTASDTSAHIGYKGKKRWVRLQNVESTSWTTHNHGAVAILGNPKRVPTT